MVLLIIGDALDEKIKIALCVVPFLPFSAYVISLGIILICKDPNRNLDSI